MLPAVPTHPFRLADAMPDCLAALQGEPGPLGLPPLRSAIVVVIDGLGARALRRRAGHARTLAGALTRRSVAGSVFPTTTAAALGTLTTGVAPGEHGLVGYSALDPARDRVVNLLRDWGAHLVPEEWQPVPTVFERAADLGLAPLAIGPARFAGSGFSRAILRGADYLGVDDVASRLRTAVERTRGGARALVYVYLPELDTAGHRSGIASEAWGAALETADAAVAEAVRSLPRDVGLLVTADHGMLDVPPTGQLVLGAEALAGVRLVAGEPRCLQLHLDESADPADVSARLGDRLGDAVWIASREEAIQGDLFGPVVRPEVVPRIGDLLVGARKLVALFASETDTARRMVGQHGALTPEETGVPLLRFGAAA